jgi:hypothetical protein
MHRADGIVDVQEMSNDELHEFDFGIIAHGSILRFFDYYSSFARPIRLEPPASEPNRIDHRASSQGSGVRIALQNKPNLPLCACTSIWNLS